MEKSSKTAKKVFSVIGNVIIWLFVIFAAVVTVFTFAAQSSEDGIPSIGGKAILPVKTDSMSPTFNKGDIIIGRKLSSDEKVALKENDVVTFDAGDLDGNGIRDFNTHRISEVVKGDDGKVTYITMGDKLKVPDKDPVDAQNVVCKYTGTRIRGVGKVLSFLQEPKGFLCCVVLPLILLFIFELFRFIRRYIEVKGGDKAQITAEDEERIRKQAVEEYLRAQGDAEEASDSGSEPVAVPAADEEAPADDD